MLTATDLTEGRLHYAHTGDLITAVRATTAYPGAISPVHLDGATLLDGGVLNQIPVDGALFLGARRVLAVNATPLATSERSGDGSALRR